MSAVAQAPAGASPAASPGRGARLRTPHVERALVWPTLFAVANAVAVVIVSPGVNDIWAALARESAVGHGVGLTYWFSWFAGAATPASYSILSPWLSHLIGVRTLGAAAAVVCTPLSWFAAQGSSRTTAATWTTTVLVAANLWSGRVPFILGVAFAIAAVASLRRGRTLWTLALGVLSGLSSPVSGAFLALALVAVYVTVPALRRSCAATLGALGVSLLLVAIVFGSPGPQHFTLIEALSCLIPLAAYLATRPPEALKVTLWLGIITVPLLYLVPNGLGSNFQRFAWYCLPPVVVACAGRRLRVVLLALLPAAVFGTIQTGTDIIKAAAPSASAQYYAPLVHELDRIGAPLRNQRLEVVYDGSHADAFALLDHAMLARGWETQEDTELNPVLYDPALDALSYKIWLQNNAVGFVAISRQQTVRTPEYTLVSTDPPDYLTEYWHEGAWTLYRVLDSDSIVNAPVRVTDFSQSRLELRVPCRCTFGVRVHWSRYLSASTRLPNGDIDTTAATVRDDGLGWTVLTTRRPGVVTLSGSLSSGLFR